MGFLELLTIVFVVLKAVGVVDWSWWVVFSPVALAAVLYISWFLVATSFLKNAEKRMFKVFDDDRW